MIHEGNQEKPVVLLIHGFPTSSYDFIGIWPTLIEHYRLISIDMLGFGFSDKPNIRNYTIHKQANLFDALVDELKLTDFHVLAHDYGVSVAQELLARQIEGTGKGEWLSCCFLNGGLFPETHQALLIQKLMLSSLGKWINKLAGFKQFARSFSTVFGTHTKPSPEELSAFWEAINFKDGRHVFHNLITYINDRRQHRVRWVESLQKSPIPLALINGSIDPVSGKHLVERYKELDCRLDYLKELPLIGHYPQVEAASEVADAYLEFVKQQP
jgi:pimeloyl-ACP methyl ester carboxylesterase